MEIINRGNNSKISILIKSIIVVLSVLPVLAFADRYGVYDDDDCCSYSGYTDTASVSEALWVMFGISLIGLIVAFSAYNEKRSPHTVASWILGVFMMGGFIIPLLSLFFIFDTPIPAIANLILIFIWYSYYTQLNDPTSTIHQHEPKTKVNNADEPMQRPQEQPPKAEPIQKTEPPPKYLLPFPLKDKPSILVNKSLYGEFTEIELAMGIIKSSATYLKQQLKSDFEFELINPQEIISNFYEMYQTPTQKRLAIVNGFGVAIHQCVWKLILANTSIDSREYLPFGRNYVEYLVRLFQNFDETSITIGTQIYMESLIDYYLSKMTQP